MSLGSALAAPCHFQLEALVAQVACNGYGIDELLFARNGLAFEGLVGLVGFQRSQRAVLAITEDDELDTVEAQQLLSELGTGIGNAVVAIVEHSHLGAVAQRNGQRVEVKGPCVDVGVDAEGGGRTIEECF